MCAEVQLWRSERPSGSWFSPSHMWFKGIQQLRLLGSANKPESSLHSIRSDLWMSPSPVTSFSCLSTCLYLLLLDPLFSPDFWLYSLKTIDQTQVLWLGKIKRKPVQSRLLGWFTDVVPSSFVYKLDTSSSKCPKALSPWQDLESLKRQTSESLEGVLRVC